MCSRRAEEKFPERVGKRSTSDEVKDGEQVPLSIVSIFLTTGRRCRLPFEAPEFCGTATVISPRFNKGLHFVFNGHN